MFNATRLTDCFMLTTGTYCPPKQNRRITKQPNLTAIIKSWRLSKFGHIACMDDDADVKMILMVLPPHNWKRPPGRPISRGWTPSNETWEPTTSHWTTQSTWLRTALCGGWCLHI